MALILKSLAYLFYMLYLFANIHCQEKFFDKKEMDINKFPADKGLYSVSELHCQMKCFRQDPNCAGVYYDPNHNTCLTTTLQSIIARRPPMELYNPIPEIRSVFYVSIYYLFVIAEIITAITLGLTVEQSQNVVIKDVIYSGHLIGP